MSKPVFLYTTYIDTTADKLWLALTDGAFTERYWFGNRVASDWQVGSAYHFTNHGTPSVEGKVLVSDPPRRLAYSWERCADGTPRERTSRVTFDIEPCGKVIKLTVTHDELDPAGQTLRDVSAGWPMVLANLKSILETGHTIEIAAPSCVQKEAADA